MSRTAFFLVPLSEHLDDDTLFVPTHYSFERQAAWEIAYKMSRKGGKIWRVVSADKVDPKWMGSDLKQLPSA